MKKNLPSNGTQFGTFLCTAKTAGLFVPIYQRPYVWEYDEQIVDFFDSILSNYKSDSESIKCIGNIVVYNNEEGGVGIIDGQQRTITILLLLRSIIHIVETMTNEDGKQNLLQIISSTLGINSLIWKKNGFIIDRKSPMMTMRSYDDINKSVFEQIMETGYPLTKTKHSEREVNHLINKNYVKILSYMKGMFDTSVDDFLGFTKYILENAYVNKTVYNDEDDALDCFIANNLKGCPLDDTDIIKAIIYGNKVSETEKSEFVRQWDELNIRAKNIGETMESSFTYLMHVLMADDKKYIIGTSMGLRNFFTEKRERLEDSMLFDKLNRILTFIEYEKSEVQNHFGFDEGVNVEIFKRFDILNNLKSNTTNSLRVKIWNIPVVFYFMKHFGKDGFENGFLQFLNRYIVELYDLFLKKEGISGLKVLYYLVKLCYSINQTESLYPKFEMNIDFIGKETFNEMIINNNKLEKFILRTYAYADENQDDVILSKCDVEHIIPKKWSETYDIIPSYSISKEAYMDENDKYINQIGNKLLFESKLNIKCSNKKLEHKSELYKKSTISSVMKYGAFVENFNTRKSECAFDEIKRRNGEVVDVLKGLLRKWYDEYDAIRGSIIGHDVMVI